MFRRAHEDAVEERHLALDLNPNFSLAYACLDLTLAYGGKGTAAVAHLDTATRISPRDPFFSVYAGVYAFAHFMAGNYGAGLNWARRSVRLSPDFPGHWRAVALSAAALEHWEEAKAAVAVARRLQPGYSVAWVDRASGDKQAAEYYAALGRLTKDADTERPEIREAKQKLAAR
jgi:adenylate cyclase